MLAMVPLHLEEYSPSFLSDVSNPQNENRTQKDDICTICLYFIDTFLEKILNFDAVSLITA